MIAVGAVVSTSSFNRVKVVFCKLPKVAPPPGLTSLKLMVSSASNSLSPIRGIIISLSAVSPSAKVTVTGRLLVKSSLFAVPGVLSRITWAVTSALLPLIRRIFATMTLGVPGFPSNSLLLLVTSSISPASLSTIVKLAVF